jgi:hypothetical protein
VDCKGIALTLVPLSNRRLESSSEIEQEWPQEGQRRTTHFTFVRTPPPEARRARASVP